MMCDKLVEHWQNWLHRVDCSKKEQQAGAEKISSTKD
jgi:hypothetical protein